MGDNRSRLYRILDDVFNYKIMKQLFRNSPKTVIKSISNEESHIIDIIEQDDLIINSVNSEINKNNNPNLKKYRSLKTEQIVENPKKHLSKLYTVHYISFKYIDTEYILKIKHRRYVIR